jgi:hypothetical protein
MGINKMHTKVMMFAIASALFVAAIYTSSTFVAFARECRIAPNGTDVICTERDDKGKISKVSYCYKEEGNWKCVDVTPKKTGSSTISPDLKNALDKAQLLTAGGDQIIPDNNTNVLKGKIEKGGSLLRGDEITRDNTGGNTPTNSNDTSQ